MPIVDLYSKRQKRIRGEYDDVYSYDEFPMQLKVQIVQIIRGAFGKDDYGSDYILKVYQVINNILCKEYGCFQLVEEYCKSTEEYLFKFFIDQPDVEVALDFVELGCRYIEGICSRRGDTPYEQYGVNGIELSASEAISDINARFKESSFGYQYENRNIIRVDSQFLHSTVVKPVLILLKDKIYSAAEQEFLKAHEHYRHHRYQECLNESLKSIESVMKVICAKQKWKFDKGDTARKLIKICLDNELIPSFLQSQYDSLRTLLETGNPTIRNKLSAHGAGEQIKEVNQTIANYALNIAASNILLLVENEKLFSARRNLPVSKRKALG